MRVWNGKRADTLEKRGWTKVFMTLDRVPVDARGILDWLNNVEIDGRWFPQGMCTRNGAVGFLYYFENPVAAEMFILKWP
jgi:hypothetical protein